MRIGELASRTGCPIETIRYYERESLLPAPARTNGNYRLYDRNHVERLLFILHCRSLDMALDEIRILLRFRDAPERNCRGVNELLDEHIEHVDERIAQLTALQRQLKSLRRRCRTVQAAKDCGILGGLQQQASRSGASKHVHVPATHQGRVPPRRNRDG